MRRATVLVTCFTCVACLAMAAFPGRAKAQPPPQSSVPPPAPAPVTEVTTTRVVGPSMPLVASGVVIFGLAYVPAVAVGVTSGLDADRTLVVPIAGPWINLTQRPGCSGDACNGENTNKVLLVTDGVFQAIGVLTTLGGFLMPVQEHRTVRSAEASPTWQISPASFGAGTYGLKVFGTF